MAVSFGALAETYQKEGPATGLPIPRYVSLGSDEANMRQGPSQNHAVLWIYHRDGLPLRVIGESGHWRKVEDSDGVKGWFHKALLSGKRTVLVTEKVQLRELAAENAQLVAILEKGVIGRLQACTQNWCEVQIQGLTGWLPKPAIWGVEADEVIME